MSDEGVAFRGLFLIDKQGKIAHVGTVLDEAVKVLLVEADK